MTSIGSMITRDPTGSGSLSSLEGFEGIEVRYGLVLFFSAIGTSDLHRITGFQAPRAYSDAKGYRFQTGGWQPAGSAGGHNYPLIPLT